RIAEEHPVAYVNTIERVALRRRRQEGRLEGKLEGKLEGRLEGKEQGEREGAAEILATLSARKFGKVPDWAQARMAQADKAALNRWAMQILDAARIEDVFV